MKKVLVLALALVASMSAATINCGVQLDVNNSNTFVCPTINGVAGFSIQNVSVSASTSFSDTTPNGTAVVNFAFGLEDSAQFNIVGSNNTGTVASANDGFVGIGSLSSGNLGNLAQGVSLTGFNIAINRSAVSGTFPLNASAQVRINYDLVNTSGVPEPSTMALLGSSLVGLAALARRRK